MGLSERREREKLARKEQILDAARTLLFKKGLQATTINQIAKLSELSVGTLYLYYKNKEEIFAELEKEGFDLLYKQILEAENKAVTQDEKVVGIAISYIDFSHNFKDYFDIINYFLSTPELLFPPVIKNRIDKTAGKILKVLVDVINSGIDCGHFRKVDPVKHAVVLWGSLHGLIHFKKMEETMLQNENYRDYVKYMLDNYLYNLKSGVAR